VFDEVMRAVRSTPIFSGLPDHVRTQIVDQARGVIQEQYLAMNEDSLAGAIPNLVAGRVALCFDIRGGNVTLDAACASSLAALDHALKCLRLGEVDVVIAGGVDFAGSGSNFVQAACVTAGARLRSGQLEKTIPGVADGNSRVSYSVRVLAG
jgi:acetyl-CoA acetyltransferase